MEKEIEDKKKIINDIKEISSKYKENNIVFTEYCKRRMDKREIKEDFVKGFLLKPDNLFYVGKQFIHLRKINLEELRYKLVFRISNKYNLIVIITEEENILKVINVIKTSRKVKREWEKEILR